LNFLQKCDLFVEKWLNQKTIDYRWIASSDYFGDDDNQMSATTGVLDGTHCPASFERFFQSERRDGWTKSDWYSHKLKVSALSTMVCELNNLF
jgi:hypothetical protein